MIELLTFVYGLVIGSIVTIIYFGLKGGVR